MRVRNILAVFLIVVLSMSLMACQSKGSDGSKTDGNVLETAAQEGREQNSETEAASEAETIQPDQNAAQTVEGEQENANTMKMRIGDTEVNVEWEENRSVYALRELAAGGLTINMSMYGGFEQVGPLGTDLPRDDEQTTTSAGDIVLYSGNQIVIFYGSNSWAYTRLGHIDLSAEEMSELLGHEDVTVTILTEKEAADPAASATSEALPDLYAMETYDSVPEYYLERHEDIDYGTLDEDVEYYSTTAGDRKYCNVLLPAGYDTSQEYPVLYMIHGWGGQYDSHIYEGSTLQTLYGNMLSEGLAVPMIIVGVDMYTDILADKDDKTEEEMRLCYDKAVDDIGLDLMPFIEEKYSVKTGRLATAVSGVSQGATTSLATGFKWQSKIGYIASLAPDPGVIPTPYYEGTYWNWPIFDDFVIESPETMPRYIYLTVGTEDPWNIDVTAYYGEVMDRNGIPNQNDLVEGYGHDSDFWALGHYNFLQKIFLD